MSSLLQVENILERRVFSCHLTLLRNSVLPMIVKFAHFFLFDKKAQSLRYLVIGGLGAVIEILLFTLLFRFGLSLFVANICAFQLALTFCFVCHYFFTYQVDAFSVTIFLEKYGKFCLLMYIQFIAGMGLLYFFVNLLGGSDWSSKALQIGIVTPVSYFVQKRKIFRYDAK